MKKNKLVRDETEVFFDTGVDYEVKLGELLNSYSGIINGKNVTVQKRKFMRSPPHWIMIVEGKLEFSGSEVATCQTMKMAVRCLETNFWKPK